ncbi:MAG: isoprenylcysteine carboxylmethyltransferase family protein [Hyphomicrobium sp.]|jgi:protein-S-isoprenylcysteine O-methyltransferase Ste14
MTTQSNIDIAEQPTRLPWPPILLIVMVAVAVLLGQVLPLPWPGLNDLPARVVGVGFGAGGVILLVAAILTLRRHGTTVQPNVGATTLVTTGPFSFFRNPIYLADVLILFGVAEITTNIWFVIGALVFGLMVTWFAILPEERHLERRFGQAYLDYKAKTRRWL